MSLDKSANAIGVSKSTVQRWEAGELVPRDHWQDVERVYGKSRLELEYGLTAEALTGGEPPYPAWHQFLEWLETVDEGARVEPWMLENLRRMRVPEGELPRLDAYRTWLYAMLATPRGPRSGE